MIMAPTPPQTTTPKLHKPKKHILDENREQPVDMHNMCSIFPPMHQRIPVCLEARIGEPSKDVELNTHKLLI
jgi:hypothetical protein